MRIQIHVLKIDRAYCELVKHYNATTRNHVRKAARRGVLVRRTCDAPDIFAYHAIYSRHAMSNNWKFEYPTQMTVDLIKMSDKARFMVAEHEEKIIGGALFLRDGNSVYYLHGVADRENTHLFPASAVLDAGIQWACESGAEFINLGNSNTATGGIIHLLAAFKSSWGAHTEQNWQFKWENPIWTQAVRLKNIVRSGEPRSPPTSRRKDDIVNSLSWSQRARLDELHAVCDADGTETKNIIMHGVTLEAGEKALSLMRKRKIGQPMVLDFGCGTGRMIRFFGERSCGVVGLDVTVEMLEAAKRHGLPKNSLLAHFDGRSFPVKDCSMDIIWVSGVLKYTLFPPGSRCLHGIALPESSNRRFIATCGEVAKEMYRVLRPGGIVANYEMWINEPPDVFRPNFEHAGFITEQVNLLRREYDYLERFYQKRSSFVIPALAASRMLAKFRYHFDDPWLAGFRDYFIVWRKPFL